MKYFYVFIVCAPFLVAATSQSAQARVVEEIAAGAGMANISFQENEAEITGENVQEVSAGDISVITANFYWRFLPKDNYSYYTSAYFPLMSSGGTGAFGVGAGIEYYFSDENNLIREKKGGFKISIDPVLRYYLAGEIGLSYFGYTTESAQKNDLNALLSLGGGAVYSFNRKYGLKFDAMMGRGVGVITSTMVMRFFASLVYYWDR